MPRLVHLGTTDEASLLNPPALDMSLAHSDACVMACCALPGSRTSESLQGSKARTSELAEPSSNQGMRTACSRMHLKVERVPHPTLLHAQVKFDE